MHALTIFNLAVLAFLLPISAHAEAAGTLPAISSVELSYPKLHESPIPNTFTFPYQTAFKDGDTTTLTAVIGSAEAITYAAVDASALGGGTLTLIDTGNVTDAGRLYQSPTLAIATAGMNGATSLTVIAASAAGTSTKTVSIEIDNTVPRFSILKVLPTIVGTAGTISLSGAIEGIGTAARLFSIVVRFMDSAGAFLSSGNEYYGYQEGAALRALRDGAYSNLVIPILESGTLLAQATALRVDLMGKDEAGNMATTSAQHSLSTTTPPVPDVPEVPTPTTTPGRLSNVLFLPALEASRLYSGDRKLWEPEGDADVMLLSPASGESVHVQPKDVITRAEWGPFRKSIYTTLFSTLNTLKHAGEIHEWVPAAYDWRASLDTLVTTGTQEGGRITFGAPTAQPYLLGTLRALASSSPTGKVTVIAHSNGGLVAKALLAALGTSAGSIVDSLILVGVPQSGTAETVALMLHGYGGALPFDSCSALPLIGNLCAGLVSRSASRSFAEQAPVAYHLLPSAQYFKSVSDGRHHVIEFHATRAYERERTVYKSAVNTLDELHGFLRASEGGRAKPAFSDLVRANVLEDEALLSYASTSHAAIDSWVPPVGMQVFQIAGFGKSTLSGIDYDDYSLPGGGVRSYYRPILSLEGDGTVQTQSAVQMKAQARVRSYWVPMGRYEHATMLESPEVAALLTNLLGISSTTPDVRTTRPTAFPRRFTITLHSPLTLEARDARGNVLTADTAEIPEGAYGELGDTKFLSLPEGAYDITMHGTGHGTFTLDIQEMDEDDAVDRTTTLAELPVTPATIARITVRSGTTSALTLDQDGNGTTDISLAPRFGYTVVYKPAPPPPSMKESVTAATSTVTAATTTIPDAPPTVPTEETSSPARPEVHVEPEVIAHAVLPVEERIVSAAERQTAAAIAAVPGSALGKLIDFLVSAFKTLMHLLFRA